MFGERDIEVVNAFVSCCVNTCVCVCVCVLLLSALCVNESYEMTVHFYAATYTCIAIYFNVHAFLIVYVLYNYFF